MNTGGWDIVGWRIIYSEKICIKCVVQLWGTTITYSNSYVDTNNTTRYLWMYYLLMSTYFHYEIYATETIETKDVSFTDILLFNISLIIFIESRWWALKSMHLHSITNIRTTTLCRISFPLVTFTTYCFYVSSSNIG